MNRAQTAAALAAILVIGLVAGVYLVQPRGSSNSNTSSQSSTSTVDPLTGLNASSVQVGSAPYGEAYDSANGYTYVAASGSHSIVVLDASDQLVKNITLGNATADFVAYDPTDQLVYAAFVGSNDVALINTTLESVIVTVPAGSGSGWVAFDPASGSIYSVNRESNTVSILQGGQVVMTTKVGGSPFAVAYDNFDANMYVSTNVGEVYIINGQNNSMMRVVQVGPSDADFLGLAYNPWAQEMAVTDYTDGKVFMMNSRNATGSIGGFNQPIGVAFSPTEDVMYVVNSGNNTVSAVWNQHTTTLAVGSDPRELLALSSGGVLVTNYGGSTLSVIT